MSKLLPPLETRPRDHRHGVQKVFADKDLRDHIIEQIIEQIGLHGAFSADIRINARESGTYEIYLHNLHASSRSEKRSHGAIDTV